MAKINVGDIIEDQTDGNYGGERKVHSVFKGGYTFLTETTIKGVFKEYEITVFFGRDDKYVIIKKA